MIGPATPAVIVGFRPTVAVILFVLLSRLLVVILIVSFEHFISFGSAPHICIGACADIIFFCWARFILAAMLHFDARAAVVVYLYLSIRCHCAGLVGCRGGWCARHR